MKKSKVTMDNFFKNVDTLMPEEMRQEIKDIFVQCKDASKPFCFLSLKMREIFIYDFLEFSAQGIKEPCDAGVAVFKCLRDVTGGEREFV